MRLVGLFLAGIVLLNFAGARAQSRAATGSAPAVTPLANGIEVSCGETHERVTALRDDVLRIRLWRGENPPEDASWAVLPQAREALAAVISAADPTHPGFRTHALSVEIDPGTLELTIRDLNGPAAGRAPGALGWRCVSHLQGHAARRALLRTWRQDRTARPAQ
jgi:hypothetical protein